MNDGTNRLTAKFAAVPPRLTARPPALGIGSVIGLLALLLVVAGLFRFNPAEHAFYPQCYFHHVTGWQCPGCGGLRAMHQLLHGHVLAALQLNAFAVLALPLCGGLLVREFLARRGGRGRWFVSPRWIWCGLAILMVFAVLRNLPAFAFLSP